MEDFMKTIKAQLYERAASPLLFSFCVSLVFWNLRLILIATSSLDPEAKLKFIDTTLYPTHWEWFLRCLLGPLMTSLFYIYIYPIPAKYVFEHTKKQQRALKQLQQEIDGETLLSREESRKILAELRKASIEYDSSIAERDTQIVQIKAQNEQLVAENAELKMQQLERDYPINTAPEVVQELPVAGSETTMILTPNEENLLKTIAVAASGVREANLLTAEGLARVQDQFTLDKLIERGLIEKRNGSYGIIYVSTPKGREVVLSLPA